MKSIFPNQTNSIKLFIITIIGLIFFIILSLILAKFWPWGSDFFYDYYPLAENWLNGQHNIYDGTASTLFYPPWSLFVIVPLGLLPIQIAHGFQLAGSLVLILLSLRLLQSSKPLPLYFIFLSLVNLHSFDLYIRGQLDAVVLFGVVLGFWAIQKRKPIWLSLGFCLMVMKPPLNVSLILLLYLISIRHWTRRELLIAFLAPFAMVVISSFAVGIDWPIAYIQNVTPRIDYLSITIWRIAEIVNIPKWPIGVIACIAFFIFLRRAWTEKTTHYTLSIALSITFLFTVYANGDHYVLLIPALIFVLQKSVRIGLLAYAATFTPLLRLFWGPIVSSIDILYPIILLLASYFLSTKLKKSAESLPLIRHNNMG